MILNKTFFYISIFFIILFGCIRKATSVSGPEQVLEFGPCGRLMRNPFSLITIQDPATQRLTWFKPPMTVLVIKKILDENVIDPFITLTTWLIEEKGMIVFVEKSVMEEPVLENQQNFSHIKNSLKTFHDQKDDLTDKIDFIICLGGDGTLLYASMLFQNQVPPIMAFHLGSLGFLTPFHFEGYKDSVTKVLQGDDVALTLRSRLSCIIRRGLGKDNITTSQLVLNDVVIDRGSSPYISNINIFFENKYITTVQGDGLIISTSTGSTAYAVAAGASMMHPSVSAIMVTPICPHSLSFRPIIVPAGVELKVALAPESRNNAWVSFDGQKREELFHGDSLIVTTSVYPVPSISAQDQISDWFDSLSSCLHWNMRKKQKHFDSTSLSQTSISTDTEKDQDYIHLETPDS